MSPDRIRDIQKRAHQTMSRPCTNEEIDELCEIALGAFESSVLEQLHNEGLGFELDSNGHRILAGVGKVHSSERSVSTTLYDSFSGAENGLKEFAIRLFPESNLAKNVPKDADPEPK